MKIRFLLLMFWMFTSRHSYAFSGNTLHELIAKKETQVAKMYVQGVLDGYTHGSIEIGIAASFEALQKNQMVNGVQLSQKGGSCFKFPSENVNADQVFDIVRKFLFEHPEIRHEEASFLVLKAVSRAFPCK